MMKKFQIELSAPEKSANTKIVKLMAVTYPVFASYFGGVQLSLRDTLRLNTSFSGVESGSGEK